MCNCIKEVEKKVLDSLKEKNPDNTYTEVETFNGLGFQRKSWAFEKNQMLLTHEMKFASTFIKVNGEQSKPRKETISITQTYCCFCGEKLIKE